MDGIFPTDGNSGNTYNQYTAYQACFATGYFRVFYPFAPSYNTTFPSLNITTKLENIKASSIENTTGVPDIVSETNLTNNAISKVIPVTPAGNITAYIAYDNEQIVNLAGPSPTYSSWIPYGTGTATQGQNIRIYFLLVNQDNSATYAGGGYSIVKFDPNMFDITGIADIKFSRQQSAGSIPPSFPSYNIYYGVGTYASDQAMNTDNGSNETWYPDLASAKAAAAASGKSVCAVKFELVGTLYNNARYEFYLKGTVKNTSNVSYTPYDNSAVYQTVSYTALYANAGDTTPAYSFPNLTAITNPNNYVKTKYNSNGSIVAGTHAQNAGSYVRRQHDCNPI